MIMDNLNEVKIDATGKKLGRLASEIAIILNGKNTPMYAPNKIGESKVTIVNASQLQITDKKKKQKKYIFYTGFFGGKRSVSMEQIIAKKGYGEVIKKAVYGMLPDNRLRSVKINKLNIIE